MLIILASAIALVAGGAGAVLASHQFSDVPNSHPFHAEIDSIADSGITTGYNDGTFRPGTNVSRMAMAAFMERGFGRTAHSDFVETLTGQSGGHTVGATSVTMEAGAAAGGRGFVQLDGTATFATESPGGCPCDVFVAIVKPNPDPEGDAIVVAFDNHVTLGNQADESGAVTATSSTIGMDSLQADTSETYTLVVGTNDTDVSSIEAQGDIRATYVPFDGDADEQTGASGSAEEGPHNPLPRDRSSNFQSR